MLGNTRIVRYIAVSIVCAVSLFFVVPPVTFAASHVHLSSPVGPKKYYLALGDSLAFGYQPDLSFNHGYVDDLFSNLKSHGAKNLANLGCPEETGSTFINGGCPYAFLHKYFYLGSQLNAALNYLHNHLGQVSPVTLDIGANDVLGDINTSKCTISSNVTGDLAHLDSNLTGIILPQLKSALTVRGKLTGDLVLMNYYDPYQNICPNTVSYIQKLNQHLANDIHSFGILSDVFTAFGGSVTPNPNICVDTWMCSIFNNIHATNKGYRIIANTFANSTG